MNTAINRLAGSITGKDTLEACSVNELRSLVESYPYFAPAQLLLYKKIKDTDPSLFAEQLQVAGLHFTNLPWLQNLLADEKVILPAVEEDLSSIPVEEEEIETTDPQAPELKIPEFKIEAIDPSKAPLSFEPYHTVDYFASQGIKFKEEEKPKDRFSQQLKSFTEWIKTMKKLPPLEAAAAQVNLQEEKKVEQLAAHSINDQKVLTEAMAEVWEKQGNAEKAVEVYGKLSLLDPSKSAYFAAKIEQLKKPG